MDAPTVQQLTTVAGAAILTSVIMFLLLKTLKLSADAQDRFGPAMAVAVGVAVVLIATFTIGIGTRADVLQAIVNGIFAGLSAIGIQNVTSKTVLNNTGGS